MALLPTGITSSRTAAEHRADHAALHAKFDRTYDVVSYGADPTGVAYSDTAVTAALTDIRALDSATKHDGVRLLFPAGTYKLAQTIELNRSIVLEGDGGIGFYPATRLVFDDGVHGIRIHSSNGTPSLAGGGTGDWSTVRGVALKTAAKTIKGPSYTCTTTSASASFTVSGMPSLEWRTWLIDKSVTSTAFPASNETFTDGVTTSGSKIVTSATAVFRRDDIGKTITGTGIPGSTTIAQVWADQKTVELSANATATATGVSVTIVSRPAYITAINEGTSTVTVSKNAGSTGSVSVRFNAGFHGISAYSIPQIEDFSVGTSNTNGFSGCGVYIDCDLGRTVNTASNNWYIAKGTVYGNDWHGLYTKGGDANNGMCSHVDFTDNGGVGVWENSFLGNYYENVHTSFNTMGAFVVGSGAAEPSLFTYCYSEGGQPPSYFNGGGSGIALLFAGDHGAGMVAKPGNAGGYYSWLSSITDGLNKGYHMWSNEATNPSTSGLADIAQIGDAYGAVQWFGYDADGATNRWRLHRNPYAGEANTFVWMFGNTTSTKSLMFTTTSHALGAGRMAWNGANGFWHQSKDNSNTYVRQTAGNAAPTTGAWLQGDIVFNTGATAGGFVGWVCVTAGTPGTWKTYGAITP